MIDARHHLRGMRHWEGEAWALLCLSEPPTGELDRSRRYIEGHALRAIVCMLRELREGA